MKIDLDIERRLTLPLPYARAEPLLRDLEGTIGRFPNLKKLTRLGPDEYLWEMRTMGVRIARIAHDVSYGARYTVDRERGELSWQPIPKQGNASIAGRFQLLAAGAQTELVFEVHGTLYDVPVPLLYRPLAGPFIVNKFSQLIERFLARTGEHLAAAPKFAAKSTPKRK